ncbi:MAG: O-antigen ligase family protein [Candidatus Scalindua sp.]|nr:O-antigen ligase family protein [Candidatus Scalindua sp.]
MKKYGVVNQLLANFIKDIRKCICSAPLPVLSMFIYIALRSSLIFSLEGLVDEQKDWHAAYLGWYDFLLIGSIAISFFINGFRIRIEYFIFILVIFVILLISFISSGFNLGTKPIIAGFVYFFRFAFAFSFTLWLVQRIGVNATENFVIALITILEISALFVLSLRIGTFNRMYSSGMSAASFSQIVSIVGLIALIRNYKIILLISIFFLLMSFSRTSILLFLFLFFISFFYIKNIKVWSKVKYFTIIIIIGLNIFFAMLFLDFSDFPFERLLNTEEYTSLNDRTDIWFYAKNLLLSGHIPLFGVGFNVTPSLLGNFSFQGFQNSSSYAVSFHSIIIEYAFGLGVLSVFIFYCLCRRIWQTFKNRCYPAFLIFILFLLSQSIDFTFYRPKEVVIWSIILGLAEGQWRLCNRKQFLTT